MTGMIPQPDQALSVALERDVVDARVDTEPGLRPEAVRCCGDQPSTVWGVVKIVVKPDAPLARGQ